MLSSLDRPGLIDRISLPSTEERERNFELGKLPKKFESNDDKSAWKCVVCVQVEIMSRERESDSMEIRENMGRKVMLEYLRRNVQEVSPTDRFRHLYKPPLVRGDEGEADLWAVGQFPTPQLSMKVSSAAQSRVSCCASYRYVAWDTEILKYWNPFHFPMIFIFIFLRFWRFGTHRVPPLIMDSSCCQRCSSQFREKYMHQHYWRCFERDAHTEYHITSATLKVPAVYYRRKPSEDGRQPRDRVSTALVRDPHPLWMDADDYWHAISSSSPRRSRGIANAGTFRESSRKGRVLTVFQ